MITRRKLAWLISFLLFAFVVNKAFSLADALTPGTLTLSAPGLFSFGHVASSNGQVTLSMHADARSMQHKLPLRKLEDARAVEAAGMPLKKHRAITSTGKVSCLISDEQMQYLLGFFELDRSNSWARPFLAQQDAEDLQTVKSQVKAWSKDAQQVFNDCGLYFSERAERCNKLFTALALTFYEQQFTPSALYHMALRNISPSEALYAFHYGREESSSFGTFRDFWATRRYRELSCNVQVLAQKHTIVAIARAHNDFVEKPANGAETLAFYKKSAELRDAFWAKEKQETPLEKTRKEESVDVDFSDIPDFPDDPEHNNNKDLLEKCKAYYEKYLKKFNAYKRSHVCQKKHLWEELVSNPLNNWEKIVEFMVDVLMTGKESLRMDRCTFEKTKRINNHSIKVTYRKVGNKITDISDGWVEDEVLMAKFAGKRFF